MGHGAHTNPEGGDRLSLDPAEVADAAALLQEQLRVAASVVQALAIQVEEARAILDRIEQRRRTLGAVDVQVKLMEDRAEAIVRMVESAEVNVAALACRGAKKAVRESE